MSETVCIDGATAVSKAERPTAILRWYGGVLQQRVDIMHFESGHIVNGSQVWRDVPTEPPTQWQPIETAPRDGSNVLVYEDGAITVVFWDEGAWRHPYKGGKTTWPNVTHWQPLPEPPAQGEG